MYVCDIFDLSLFLFREWRYFVLFSNFFSSNRFGSKQQTERITPCVPLHSPLHPGGSCTLEPLEGAQQVLESITLPLGKTAFDP